MYTLVPCDWSSDVCSSDLVEKRWVYALCASPEVFLCVAIIDAGLLDGAFLAVFDRKSRALVADRNVALPARLSKVSTDPGRSLRAELRAPGARASIVRAGTQVGLAVDWPPVWAELVFDTAGAPMPASACGSLGQPHRFDFTQKSVLLPARGAITVGERSWSLEGAVAGLDFTHGLFCRETRWRWAFGMGAAAGRPVALNLSEWLLFGGASENVLWLDGTPRALPPVTFEVGHPADGRSARGPLGGEIGASSDAAWRITSADRAVDLTFAPEGQRSQDTDVLGLLTSRYVQPFGVFSGNVSLPGGERLVLDAVPGVTEEHFARW
jgi:hypothetical protein